MNENELRGVIRKQIRKVLSEAPRLGAGGAELERGLGKIGGRTSRFSRRQRVQALLPVLKKFNIEATPTLIINDKKFDNPHNYKKLKKTIEKLI